MTPIHSFRSPELSTKTGITSVNKDGCCAFLQDITVGLPKIYSKCDILYSEPSWLRGYDIFKARAGEVVGTFQEYLLSISRIIRDSKIPVILLCGKQSLKKFPPHTSELPVMLNGYGETAYAWGIDISRYAVRTNEDLLGLLAWSYDCVGDFSCGYGVAGRIFREHGKKFVMSDINEKCITYISEWLHNE